MRETQYVRNRLIGDRTWAALEKFDMAFDLIDECVNGSDVVVRWTVATNFVHNSSEAIEVSPPYFNFGKEIEFDGSDVSRLLN